MSTRPLRNMRSLPSMRRSLHSSSATPNPSHLLSSQQDTVRTHFTALTVPALKSECRQRGLKLTGRKVDLIDRIVGYERAQSFSSAAHLGNLKNIEPLTKPNLIDTREFSSSSTVENPESIDAYQFPTPQTHHKADAQIVSKIPVAHNSKGGSVEQIPTKGVRGDTGVSAGDVHVVNESSRVSTMNVDLGDGAPKHDEEKLGHKPSNKLPSKDRKFLWGLGALIALWWAGPGITVEASTEDQE